MAMHGRAWGDDGLFHYVHWIGNKHNLQGGHWNGITWCSYELEPDTPSGLFIRCYDQESLGKKPITCMRCAARAPGDPRPWGPLPGT
jgi:hypothetical protein